MQRGGADTTTRPAAGVVRHRLLGQLDAIPSGGLGVVVAPAGSGKSTLVHQWAAGGRERVARIELRAGHRASSPAFGMQLEAALSGVTGARPDAPGWPHVPITARLVDVQEPLALLVEDAHLLDADDARVLDDLVAALPETVRVVVTARWGPPIPLHEHRLLGQCVELRSGDLAFSVEEANELLHVVSGRLLTADHVAALTERTRGWAAGLHLAGLSLRTAPDIDAFVEAFAGDDRLVAEYLTAEVLDGLSDELRHFLLATAPLDELTPSFCDAIVDQGATLLADAERLSLFLTPAAEADEPVRFHPLFADLLRLTLRARTPELEASVHERAAAWYLDQRQPERAIDHLLAAGRIDRARPLIDVHGRKLWELGGSGQLLRWLEQIAAAPDATIIDQLTLMVACKADDRAADVADMARALRARVDLAPGERAVVEAYAATLGHYEIEPSHVLASATASLALIEDLDEREIPSVMGLTDRASLEVLAQGFVGISHLYQGHLDHAVEAIVRASELPGARYPRWRIHVLGTLALIRGWTGHLREANGLAAEALALATQIGQSTSAAVTSAHLAHALVALESDRVAEVSAHLDHARAIASAARRTADLDVLDALHTRAVALTAGARAALVDLHVGGTDRSHRRLRPLLSDARAVLEARIRLATGQVPQARALLAGLPSGQATSGARIELALTTNDVETARLALEQWTPESTDRGARLARDAWTAAVLAAEGDQRRAIAVAAQVAAAAEVEGHQRALLDVPAVLPLLRPTAQERSADFVRVLLASPRPGVVRPRPDAGDALIEPLTERELELVQLLPSRLSNKELAAACYVSVNTVKTHLRAIYRKLGVENRDEAIRRATDLDLFQ